LSGQEASPALQKTLYGAARRSRFQFRKAMTPSLSRRIVRSRGSPVGAYCRFDSGAVNVLREILRAVAAYASGGMKALNAMPVRSSCWNR
jgi:hypothetical protein